MANITVAPVGITPGNRSWIEVGTNATLSVPGNNTITFTSQNPSVASISGTTLTAIGFGLTAISASDPTVGNFDLFVGSVIVVGADGFSWQLFADGSVNGPLASGNTDISQRMQNLEKDKVLFADVGNQTVSDITNLSTRTEDASAQSATAVTCYLLNLEAVALQNQSNNKQNND